MHWKTKPENWCKGRGAARSLPIPVLFEHSGANNRIKVKQLKLIDIIRYLVYYAAILHQD